MTSKLTELATTLAKSHHFRWMDGMADCWGGRCRQGDGVDRINAFPDLVDPATQGCILHIARTLYANPERLWGGRLEVHQDHHDLFFAVIADHDLDGHLFHRHVATGATEVEAIVNAILAK